MVIRVISLAEDAEAAAAPALDTKYPCNSHPQWSLFVYLNFFSVFGHALSIQKCLGQGWNPHQGSTPGHWSDKPDIEPSVPLGNALCLLERRVGRAGRCGVLRPDCQGVITR